VHAQPQQSSSHNTPLPRPTCNPQIEKEVRAFSNTSMRNVRSCIVVGGVSMQEQRHDLRAGSEVVVATPGRFIDHLQQVGRGQKGRGADGRLIQSWWPRHVWPPVTPWELKGAAAAAEVRQQSTQRFGGSS